MVELHEEQTAPLREALHALGDRDPALTARLVSGIVRSAASLVVEGASKADVERRTLALVRHGLLGVAPA
jgi:hypothetical protein